VSCSHHLPNTHRRRPIPANMENGLRTH